MLPELVNITPAKVHDSNGFEQTVFAKDTIIIENKGYWDFDVIKARNKAGKVLNRAFSRCFILAIIY